ncbi:MAG TPA: sulfate transporter [Bacteroidetes bacterium]|nr:sulfate transporter [Bacteroidota bacterium]
MKSKHKKIPASGIAGLTAYWKSDLVSGFLVFLLALPLSLGIAKASGFPAAMGVLTAMIGGLFVSFFKVSPLTIKGPAAGLITVSAASIAAMGGGDMGWHATGAIIVTMAFFQLVFAWLKFGSFSDFFPHSAVHGMLAAVGLIIIAKQIPVLLGDDPIIYKGEGPIELFMDIPRFIHEAHWHIAFIGIISLIILFGLPMLKIDLLKRVPAPMIVLILAVPLAVSMHFRETEPGYSLVNVGNFWDNVKIQPDFSGIFTFPYWKYVIMFLFVNSLESLLTVKAVDNLDPYKRESDYNDDLKALGAGNALSGLLGGLPMISEVVRSSANINFGARTKWSNFFHGVFLLLAMLLMIPLIEMIPNTALAAMLIYAGYRLAAPREFFNTYQIGKEQLAIFITTILVTLFEDLLLGVAAGILVKILFHLYNGAPLNSLFKGIYSVEKTETTTTIHVNGSAVFSNLLGYKKVLLHLPEKEKVIMDFSKTRLIDHSFMHFIHHFEHEYNNRGGEFKIAGLKKHKCLSDHPLATRKLKKA